MENPLVIIGVTSYNHERYIEVALDSILLESYPNKEVVIIDDGSSDNSVQVIKSWIAKNKLLIPITFICRENKGVTYTVNQILDNVKGKYIALLASDDAFCNNSLAKRISLLQKTGKMLAVGDCSVIDADGNITHKSWMKDVMKKDINKYATDRGIMKEVLTGLAFSGSVLLIDMQLYKQVGRYPNNFYAEDHFLYQRSAALKQLAYLDEVISLYRRHDTNASGPDLKIRKHIIKSIIKNYWLNWWLFPGVEMKLVALKQWIKWNYIYIRTYII